MKALIVTEPFAGYAKGEQISDPEKMKAALAGNASSVVAINVPEPEPAPVKPVAPSQS